MGLLGKFQMVPGNEIGYSICQIEIKLMCFVLSLKGNNNRIKHEFVQDLHDNSLLMVCCDMKHATELPQIDTSSSQFADESKEPQQLI